jgi:hypothetical protein
MTGTPDETREAWRDEWRTQWELQSMQLERIIAALEGGSTVTALEDLISAVSGNQAVSERIATMVDGLQDQVTQLQATVDELNAQSDVDLAPITAQINAITESLTAAEAPNVTEGEDPAEVVPDEG